MLIGELAQRSGLTPDTIRFYEKKGLLDERHMLRRENNYKEYNADALERLTHIARIKRTGFTLSEIERWMREWDTLNPDQRRRVILDKVKEIDGQIAALEEVKSNLMASLSACVVGDHGNG